MKAGTAETPKKSILIVEDDSVVGELLTLRLGGAGYRPHLVTSGAEAIAQAREIHPALVLLDLGLPDIDGFNVMAELRAERETRDLPVLVLTARHNAADVMRAISLGAVDFVAKPFLGGPLLRRIERAIANHKPPRAAGATSGSGADTIWVD
jgi:DNA-binding response OmpR family regulator